MSTNKLHTDSVYPTVSPIKLACLEGAASFGGAWRGVGRFRYTKCVRGCFGMCVECIVFSLAIKSGVFVLFPVIQLLRDLCVNRNFLL